METGHFFDRNLRTDVAKGVDFLIQRPTGSSLMELMVKSLNGYFVSHRFLNK
jgi:hypothetical protein